MNDRRPDSNDDPATLAARIVLDVLRERGELDLLEGRAGGEGEVAPGEVASPERGPAAPVGDPDDRGAPRDRGELDDRGVPDARGEPDTKDPRAIARTIVERVRAEHGMFETRGGGAWPAADGAGQDAPGQGAAGQGAAGADELRGRGEGVRTGAGAVPPPMAYQARLAGNRPLVLVFGDPVDPAGGRWPDAGAGAATGAAGPGGRLGLAERVDQALAPLLRPSPIDLVEAVVGAAGRAVRSSLVRSRWVIVAVLAGIGFVVTFRLGMAALQDVVDLRLEIDPPTTSSSEPPDAAPVPPG